MQIKDYLDFVRSKLTWNYGLKPPPVVQPEIYWRPEWEAALGQPLASGWADRAADAGNLTAIQIFNPAASSIYVVVIGVVIQPTLAGAVPLFYYDTPLSEIANSGVAYMDRRLPGTPIVQVRTDVLASVPAAAVKVALNQIGAQGVGSFNVNSTVTSYLLGPSQGLVWITPAVNTQCRASFAMRELRTHEVPLVGAGT
jgi:hypothetical protein